MRVSSDTDDPDYWMKVIGFSDFEVRCNGVPVSCVIEADEERGVVKAYALDKLGKPMRMGDEFKVVVLAGKVEIIVGADALRLAEIKARLSTPPEESLAWARETLELRKSETAE